MIVKNIAILGSTGSIGTQALEVIRNYKDLYTVSVLTAGNNADLLIQQALEFRPSDVVIASESKYKQVKDALSGKGIHVHCGERALEQVVSLPEIDMVLTAMVGSAGLMPTVQAILSKKDIALANKETLVVAGEHIMRLAAENKVKILPVDSEHSAIYQCLVGERHQELSKVILTASGGPFRGYNRQQLEDVTIQQALNHPNWSMGKKITIDSATLMNKGLEVIEAKWLFNIDQSQIDVLVHPQSIVHSMVQLVDGSLKAQLGHPDMKLPIQYAFSYPERLAMDNGNFSLADVATLTFERPDMDTFRNLALAFEALEEGGNRTLVLNAANEVAVEAFLNGEIPFLGISRLIEETLKSVPNASSSLLEDLIVLDSETKALSRNILRQLS